MKAILLLLFILLIAFMPYIIRHVVNASFDKIEDTIRNKRIDRERGEKTPEIENLADRYNN